MNETRQQALPVGTRIGVYEIRRVIGTGRFGITYQVWNQHLNSEMALKEYFPRDIVQRAGDGLTVLLRSEKQESLFQLGLDKFSEDADKLARIEHPHLQQVQNDLQIHGTVYLVMEYEDGIPLSRLIERSEKVLDEEQLKVIFLPIIEALGKAHEVGVLHGDINPTSILLRKTGESVLLDFASARLTLAAPLGLGLEVFSEGYAPAEQYDPKGQIGPWSDLYSIGATLYRCVTGNESLSATDRLADVSQGKPDPQWPAIEAAVAGYHENFLKAIDWMLSIHPEDRPQSVGPLLESLNVQSEAEVEADATSSQRSSSALADSEQNALRRVRPSVSLLIFVTIAAVLLIGTVLWYSGRDRRADEILAAAESHRLASLGFSEDKAMEEKSASTVDQDGARESDNREQGSYKQTPEANVSGSQSQAQELGRPQETDDPLSDALPVRDDSSMDNSQSIFGSVESMPDANDREQETDMADTKVELVELFDGLRGEDEFEVAGGEWYSTEAVPESLPTPMNPLEPSPAQENALSDRELSVASSPDLPQAVTRSSAEEFDRSAAAEPQAMEPAAGSQTMERPSASQSGVPLPESPREFDATVAEPENAQAAQTEISSDSDAELDEAKGSDTDEAMASAAPDLEQVSETDFQGMASTLSPEDRIARHMAAAEEDIKALRLSTPPGDNALEHYQAVLTLDSGHSAAQEGVRHIVEVYGWLIDRAIEQEQLVVARVYLQRAEEIMPEAPELQQARLDLRTVQPAQETEFLEEAE